MNWIVLAAEAAAPGQQGAPAAPAQDPFQALLSMLPLFIGIFVIFYFLMIRPQKKQEKARKEMLKVLKKNDKVVTIGGIHGVVANVRDSDVTLKVDESGDVRLRFERSAISRVLSRDDEEKAQD